MPNPSLISRLEEATEGSRELDAEIGIAAGLAERRRHSFDGEEHIYELRDSGSTNEVYWPDAFTTSIDAAVALVERLLGDEYWWIIERGRTRSATIGRWNPSGEWYATRCATPALALCLAALKAMEATPTSTGRGKE